MFSSANVSLFTVFVIGMNTAILIKRCTLEGDTILTIKFCLLDPSSAAVINNLIGRKYKRLHKRSKEDNYQPNNISMMRDSHLVMGRE